MRFRLFPTPRFRPGLLVLATSAVGCHAAPSDTSAVFPGARESPSTNDAVDTTPFSAEEKRQSGGKLGGVWVTCYSAFRPSSDPADDLARLGRECGQKNGLQPVTAVRVGETQAQQDPAERFTFRTHPGRCYRFFAVGSPEIADLDLALVDANGKLAAADVSKDRWPVLPPRGPFCSPDDGIYTIEASVARGAGNFVMQVWGE